MARNPQIVKIVSGGLVLIYILSLVIYGQAVIVPEFRLHAVLIVMLFLVLLAGALGAFDLHEWGRKTLILTNTVAFIYLLGLYTVQPDVIPLGYFFMNIITILFFTQAETKALYMGSGSLYRKSILIVDDDAGLLKCIKPILLATGYSVLTAMTGEKGIQIAQRQKPDLIILDVILPGIKGRQVCVKLKDDPLTQKIPVIFLTAKDSPDDVRAELAAGAIAHITKPFTPQELLDEIRKAVGA